MGEIKYVISYDIGTTGVKPAFFQSATPFSLYQVRRQVTTFMFSMTAEPSRILTNGGLQCAEQQVRF